MRSGRSVYLSMPLLIAGAFLLGCDSSEPPTEPPAHNEEAIAALAPSTVSPSSRDRYSLGGVVTPDKAPPATPPYVRPAPKGTTEISPATSSRITGAASADVQPANPFLPSCTTHSIVSQTTPPNVIKAPIVHVIFWGDWTKNGDPQLQTSYTSTWTALAATPAFYTRISEYGVSPGSYGGSISYSSGKAGANLPESPPGTSGTIQKGLLAAIGSNSSGANDIWVILLANGTTAQYDTGGGFGGHHQTFTNSGTKYRYAVIEYNSGTQNPLVSHEIMEAATDPDFNGYIDKTGPLCGNQNCEIGDPCQSGSVNNAAGFNVSNFRNIAGVQVEQIWSQKACVCVTERSLNTVNYPNFLNGEDPVVFRPSNANWFVKNRNTAYWAFGQSGDVPYAADVDGDGRAEWVLFRDGAPGTFFVLNTLTGVYNTTTFGYNGDIPVRGDFDGDGKADIAVYHPSDGTWHVIASSGINFATVQWGNGIDDYPVPGDYDGDGKTDPAVFRPSANSWYILYSSTGGSTTWTWSATGNDVIVPGDYNGDGITDLAFWRPSTGVWSVQYMGGSAWTSTWGVSGDVPLVGDFDNDWQTDLAVWRPSTGEWFPIYSSTFSGQDLGAWGIPDDLPVDRAALR